MYDKKPHRYYEKLPATFPNKQNNEILNWGQHNLEQRPYRTNLCNSDK